MQNEAKWYVLHTFSGYEKVAKDNLELSIKNYNLQDRIFEIIIPTEDVIEEKNGKKQVVNKKILPSYIFIKMIYGDDIWHAITRTRGVTGFAGPKGRPLPLTEDEIQRMHLEDIECQDVKVGDKIELVNILEGATGVVIRIDEESKIVTALVETFGKETEIELTLTDFKKI